MRAAELLNALNARNIDISARYALTRKNAAITAAITLQRNAAIAAAITTHRNAQTYHLRHASDAQPATEESINDSQRSAQKG